MDDSPGSLSRSKEVDLHTEITHFKVTVTVPINDLYHSKLSILR